MQIKSNSEIQLEQTAQNKLEKLKSQTRITHPKSLSVRKKQKNINQMTKSAKMVQETEKYFKKVFESIFHDILFLIEGKYLGFFSGTVPESVRVEVDLDDRIKLQVLEIFKVFITFCKNFIDVAYIYKSIIDLLSKILVKSKPSNPIRMLLNSF